MRGIVRSNARIPHRGAPEHLLYAPIRATPDATQTLLSGFGGPPPSGCAFSSFEGRARATNDERRTTLTTFHYYYYYYYCYCYAQVAARKTSAQTRGRRSVAVNAALNVKDLKPTGTRVLVIADEAETTTSGGILLSSAETNTGPGSSITGKVASIGAEVKGVKAGDKVLVNGFSGSDVEFGDGSKGKFITMEDVIAVIS